MEDDGEISQGLKDWEQIQPPPPLQSSSSSSSSSSNSVRAHAQSQAHSRGWEMVANREGIYDDCSIFPPSNHEGLHIPLEQQQEDEDGPPAPAPAPEPEPEPSSSPSDIDGEGPPRQPFDTRLRVAGDIVMKRLGLGFKVLCSKILRIASSARSYTSSRGAVWSFASALLVFLLYLRWRRWRRRSQQEKMDRLINLVEETDEKISRLLDQITQMNEVLSARRRVPVSRNG